MRLSPVFVVGGVYLQTDTGEMIGRLNESGDPFATLEEAREKADWLEMTLHYQRSLQAASKTPIAKSQVFQSVPRFPTHTTPRFPTQTTGA